MKIKNIFYCNGLFTCGGIETFEYYIIRELNNSPDYDIEIWYRSGDKAQLELMSKYAKCVQWDGVSIIKCDNFFFPSRDIGKVLRYVEAKNIVECFHMAEDRRWNTLTSPKVTKCIAVSQAGADLWKKVTGRDCECYYPVISIDKYEKPDRDLDGGLKLVTVSRLDTDDKGAPRMKIMADYMDEHNIKYQWDLYGINSKRLTNQGFHYCGRVLDKDKLFSEVVKHDFLVQLSDAEGFGMSVAEALHLNVPVIVTPFKTVKEQLITEVNGVVLDFDCHNVGEVVNKITRLNYDFNYVGPESDWRSLLCQR